MGTAEFEPAVEADDDPATGLGLITSQPGFIAGSLLELALIAGGIFAVVRRRRAARAAKRS